MHFRYDTGILIHGGGNIELEAIASVNAVTGAVTKKAQDGKLIPNVDIGDYNIKIKDDSTHIKITNTIWSWISDLLNHNIFWLSDLIEHEVLKALQTDSFKGNIQKLINNDINDEYPEFVNIPPANLAISTTLIKVPDITQNGITLWAEGLTFPMGGNMNQYSQYCNNVAPININSFTNTEKDVYAAIGGCTVKTLVATFENNGFKFKLPFSYSDFHDLTLGLVSNDEMTVTFLKDVVNMTIAAKIAAGYQNTTMDINCTLDLSISLTQDGNKFTIHPTINNVKNIKITNTSIPAFIVQG